MRYDDLRLNMQALLEIQYYGSRRLHWYSAKKLSVAVQEQHEFSAAKIIQLKAWVLAHDQRFFLLRWAERLFTKVERTRARLCYIELAAFSKNYLESPLTREQGLHALRTVFPDTPDAQGWQLAAQIKKLSYWSSLRRWARALLAEVKIKVDSFNLNTALVSRAVPEQLGSDPYHVLGITKKANHSQIVQAYRSLALQYHPDRNKSPDAAQQFRKVDDAYRQALAALKPAAPLPAEQAMSQEEYETDLCTSGGYSWDEAHQRWVSLAEILQKLEASGARQDAELAKIKTDISILFSIFSAKKTKDDARAAATTAGEAPASTEHTTEEIPSDLRP